MAAPKRQVASASKVVVGAVFYTAFAHTTDDGKTETGYDEWVVRSIQAKRGSKSRYGVALRQGDADRKFVNLAMKLLHVTWGRRSTKTGDYGWKTSIPDWCRKQFEFGGPLPPGLFTTPLAAVKYELKICEGFVNDLRDWLAKATDADEITELKSEQADNDAQIKALKRRLNQMKKKD